jgi:anti-anti-sigma regulatory factor
MDGRRLPPAPSVRVRHGLGDARRPITVIQVVGEHDYASRGMLEAALEPLDGYVVVDLTNCTFIDTAVIGPILGKALAFGKTGHRFELVVPPTAPLARTVKRLGVPELLPVLDELPSVRPCVLSIASDVSGGLGRVGPKPTSSEHPRRRSSSVRISAMTTGSADRSASTGASPHWGQRWANSRAADSTT